MIRLYPKTLFITLLALFFVLMANANYLKNVPQKIVQPNGEIVNCYASGDEYYHWLHDEEGFTIVQNPLTGYFCYAIMDKDVLLASQYIAGVASPLSVGLTPYTNISPEKMREKREHYLSMDKEYLLKKTSKAPNAQKVNTKGAINNVVIYIRFAGESEFSVSQTDYTEMFNSTTTGVVSQHNYFNEVSYSTLNINTSFLPSNNGTTIISYQDSHPREYYMVYNATTNPQGYTDTQTAQREHTLLKSAIESVASQLPAGLNVDSDSDGYVDGICFIVQGSAAGWSEILWPHKWNLYTYRNMVSIGGKKVDTYNLQIQNSLDVSVLCHEMFHTLGAPDLYHYTKGIPVDINPVGVWDLMNQDNAQHMTQYMKWRYGKWIDNIPEITTSGNYTLNPVFTKENSCYMIKSPFSTTDYFVIEYRKKEKLDVVLPNEGLLVYKINQLYDGQGNGDGPPDELYVYRPGGSTTTLGTLSAAPFSANLGKTSFDDKTNPDPFLSTGAISGLSISNISTVGTTMTFHVDIFSPKNIDVGVTKILTPVTSPTLTSAEKIKVNISGLGTSEVASGVTVNYRINNGTVVSENFTGSLTTGKSIPFEFATPANLATPGTYKIKVYTTLTGDQNTANDTATLTITSFLPLDYLASRAVTFIDTYNDITTGTIITVDQAKDGLSSPTSFPDGFTFKLNGTSFSQFILSTNGFIKLGDQNPSSKSLYFTTYNTADGGIFNSTSSADNGIIAPFNHNLTAGTGGAEYRMAIEGTSPNRIVTIQFKNVRDNNDAIANQYSSMSFQIKLYEESNVIDFVYGTWTSSGNTSYFKTSLCGIRGMGNLPSQLIAVNKGSSTAWNQITFANSNYSTTATLNFGNGSRPAPENGRVIRFAPILTRYLTVREIYSMGQLPIDFATPHTISAAIVNNGTEAQSNIDVTLNVTGTNSFSPSVVNIPSISPNQEVVVSFNSYSPSIIGTSTISVTVPNNSSTPTSLKSITQSLNANVFNYVDPQTSAESAYTGSFIAACKYHVNTSARITSVDAMILNSSEVLSKSTKAYVFNANGAIIGQSNSYTVVNSSLGKWITFAITTPPFVANADFYVGLDCSNSYFGSYQTEKPTRSGAFFQIPIGGGSPLEFGYNARLMFRANATPSTGIDPNENNIVKIYSNTSDIFVELPTFKENSNLYVYNILGALVYKSDNLNQGVNKIRLNTVPGTYIVRVMTGNTVQTQKVVIE